MSPEDLRGKGTSRELAQQFTYEDREKIPAGVSPSQLDFLREASTVEAFSWVKPATAEMLTKYFTTEATYADLAKEYGITKQAVQERITRGIGKMHRVLYKEKPELAQEDKYPLEQIRKGKDETKIFKTEKSKQRRSEASRRRDSIRRPGIDVFDTKTDFPLPSVDKQEATEQSTTPTIGRYDVDVSPMGLILTYEDTEDRRRIEFLPSEALRLADMINAQRQKIEQFARNEHVLENINAGEKPFPGSKELKPSATNKSIQRREQQPPIGK